MRSNQGGGGGMCENDLAEKMGKRRCCFFSFQEAEASHQSGRGFYTQSFETRVDWPASRFAKKPLVIGAAAARSFSFSQLLLLPVGLALVSPAAEETQNKPRAFPPSIMLTLGQDSSPAQLTPLYYSISSLDIFVAHAETQYPALTAAVFLYLEAGSSDMLRH